MKNTFRVLALVAGLTAAAVAGADEPERPRERSLTLGAIQRSIKEGMSSSEVVEAAGSPNLVTRGRDGKESWVYDRFATETKEENAHVSGGGIAFGAVIVGAAGGEAGSRKLLTSQRTLMLMVTFGPDGVVESFAYRASRF